MLTPAQMALENAHEAVANEVINAVTKVIRGHGAHISDADREHLEEVVYRLVTVGVGVGR